MFSLIFCTSSSQEATHNEAFYLFYIWKGRTTELLGHGHVLLQTAPLSLEFLLVQSHSLDCFYSLLPAHVESTHYQGVPRSHKVTGGGERFVGGAFKQSHTCDDVILQNPFKLPYGNQP